MKLLSFFFFLAISILDSATLNAQETVINDQLYVKFKSDFLTYNDSIDQEKVWKFLSKELINQGLDSAKCSFKFSKNSDLKSIYRLWFDTPIDATECSLKLSRFSNIEYVEFVPKLLKFLSPNDLGSNSSNDGGQWYLHKIKSQDAWDIQTGSSFIKVAVIDDAFQTNHPDLNGICYPGFDIAHEDFDVQPPSSAFDHGTHIAGLIAAKTNNNIGIASLAHGVFILPIKATFDNNPDVVIGGFEGIAWATENQVNVINCSWGSSTFSQTGLAVVNNAIDSNIVVVAAAGNFNNTVIQYPAGYNGVISVSSTGLFDVKSSFSSFGSWVDISAPGNQIWSTSPFDNYTQKDGTSFAAPLVSALAALLKSKDNSLTPSEIESCIKNSADDLSLVNPDYEGLIGAGRINAQQALICLGLDSIDYNLSISSIENLSTYSCDYLQSPVLTVKNDGFHDVTSFKVKAQLDVELPFIFDFEGVLASGDSILIQMQELSLSPGNHVYTVSINEILNDSFNDVYLANNVIAKNIRSLSNLGQALPFFENFESGSFISNQWFLVNDNSPISWEINTSFSLAQGSKVARLNYFNDDNNSSRDLLTSRVLDFSGFSSVELSFDHAYQGRINSLTDSLIISISDDCGSSWNRLAGFGENGSFNFATLQLSNSEFIPSTDTSWCGQPNFAECSQFDLTDYAGQTNVIVRFEGYSMNGNNIYIDNINISGIPNNQPPVASFNAAWDLPVCSSKQVAFASTSAGIPNSFQWTFEGGNPAVSSLSNPIVSYNTEGNYDVQLIVQNASGSDTLLLEDYVEVLENPFVTITTDTDTICVGASANLTASGALSYIWNSGQAMSANDGEEITVSPITSANYIVNGITSAGCADTALQRIVVITSPPQPSITVNGGTLVASNGSGYEWYFNGALVENANEQFYIPTANGNYNVRVFIPGGCSSISGIFPVNFVGIDELLDIDSFALYPNPANEAVNFYVPFDHQVDWNVFDARGRLIQGGNTSQSWVNLETRDFAEGLYLIRLSSTKSGNISVKFVVKH